MRDVVGAVRASCRKTLVMAGVRTSVCVIFPALDAVAAGFDVYAVIDACGNPNESGVGVNDRGQFPVGWVSGGAA